jgi:hypothetical protein
MSTDIYERKRTFGGPVPAAPVIKTGSDAIRARVWSRWRRSNLSRIAMDLQIPLAALEAFAKGEGQLPEAALHALTKEFFMNTRYDPVDDLLVDTRPPPLPACPVMSEPWKNPNPKVQAAYEAYLAALAAARPPEPARSKPLTPGAATSGRPAKRPGFA